MTELLSPELIEKLAEIAQKEARSVEELVRDMVEHYEPALDQDQHLYEQLVQIIKTGDFDQLPLLSKNHNIPEMMRELLARSEISIEDFPPGSSLRLLASALRMRFEYPDDTPKQRINVEDYPANSFARLAASARNMPALIDDGIEEDIEEVLRTEFTDYLLSRLNTDAIDESDTD